MVVVVADDVERQHARERLVGQHDLEPDRVLPGAQVAARASRASRPLRVAGGKRLV
jgi:hypothetical protein